MLYIIMPQFKKKGTQNTEHIGVTKEMVTLIQYS